MTSKAGVFFKSIFARLFLLISFFLLLVSFLAVIVLAISPGFSNYQNWHGFYTLSTSSSIGNPSYTINSAGIFVLALTGVSLLFNFIVLAFYRGTNYKINKYNKITRPFLPLIIGLIFVLIIALIDMPGLFKIKINNGMEWNSLLFDNSSLKIPGLINNYSIAGWAFIAVASVLTISYLIHAIIFVIRLVLSRNHIKPEANLQPN